MKQAYLAPVAAAKEAALQVLLHNAHGPFHGLPRTAAWGYPEPYTRDLMIATLGIAASGNEELLAAQRRVFETLATYQTPHGHIPSLVHRQDDLGASDTTPLFLLAVGIYRQAVGEPDFLEEAVERALRWMALQSPGDEVIVGQLPTSDWRDEQWVLGFGLFVNATVYANLRQYGRDEQAAKLRLQMLGHFMVEPKEESRYIHDCLVSPDKPYYALWRYKVYGSDRFDLLGNSLAILSGLTSPTRAHAIIEWVETECAALRAQGELAAELPPNFFPYIRPDDPDWLPRYTRFNLPGEYHNGGIWPFICGFYVPAILAAGLPTLAEEKLMALTDLVRLAHNPVLPFGFNEWIRAQDGTPRGQDWQTWSAAMYLYAASCVEQGKVLFFDDFRTSPLSKIDEAA